jgi:osmotically-inducible protein OsmY
LARIDGEDRNIAGIALSAALGFGLGLAGGLLLREFVGFNTEPVKKTVKRLSDSYREPKEDFSAVEEAVVQAWENDPDLRPLPLAVEALGDGIVEITGTASSQMTRQLASDVARSVQGADVVLNRIHIEGIANEASEPEPAPETG